MDQMFEAILDDLVGEMALKAMINSGQLHKEDLNVVTNSKENEELNKLTEDDLKLEPEKSRKDKNIMEEQVM